MKHDAEPDGAPEKDSYRNYISALEKKIHLKGNKKYDTF